jgi:hypothetical protein
MKGFSSDKERDEFLRGLQFTRIKKTVIKIKTLIVHNYLVVINNICQTFLSHISLTETNK